MRMMNRSVAAAIALALGGVAGPLFPQEKGGGGWVPLFNGKDLTGWKLRQDKYTLTKFVDDQGKVIAGAREAKVGQTLVVVDAKGKVVVGAKVARVDGKDVPVDGEGRPIPKAKLGKV